VRSGSRIRQTVGLVGLIALALGFVRFKGAEVPTVALVEPIYAAPAERVEVRSLAQDQTLGDLLSGVLDANAQSGLILALREEASPRRMRPGTEVAFRWLQGETPSLRAVDIKISADETVRLAPSLVGWDSELIETPVQTDTVWVAGEIQSSLWESVYGNDHLAAVVMDDRAELILELEKVFQWQVDFLRQIRTGDFYRFAFEREVRPDGSMRQGHVLSAELVNRGRSLQALWFDPNGDGSGTYYDPDGNSVRRAFLKSPITLRYRISSAFSTGRLHPVLNTWRAHRGVDFAANAGTPIRATGNGRVTRRGSDATYGNVIYVEHSNGWTTRYAHMSRFAPGFRVGSRVSQEEVIGYVGMTGLATGPHLHYEMRSHGDPKDPLSVDLPAGDPVPTDQWESWQSRSGERLALLDRLPLPWDVDLAVKGGDGVESDPGAR
jgi:murein DD-endopeptidase MepM/ murein hydrolase activator NlpD